MFQLKIVSPVVSETISQLKAIIWGNIAKLCNSFSGIKCFRYFCFNMIMFSLIVT